MDLYSSPDFLLFSLSELDREGEHLPLEDLEDTFILSLCLLGSELLDLDIELDVLPELELLLVLKLDLVDKLGELDLELELDNFELEPLVLLVTLLLLGILELLEVKTPVLLLLGELPLAVGSEGGLLEEEVEEEVRVEDFLEAGPLITPGFSPVNLGEEEEGLATFWPSVLVLPIVIFIPSGLCLT